MSTSTAIHWSKHQKTATPTANKSYSTQLQSSLFRLPRELRDVIYEYYAQDRRPYKYNKETHQLRYEDESARAENLGLMVTCRIAAEEMRQVAFQKAEFSTRCSAYDAPEFMGLRSRAARLHCLTNLIQTQRQRMLICAAGLLQPSDFDDIEARYPNMGLYFSGLLPQAVAERHDTLRYGMGSIWADDVAFQACIDALLFALNCANTRNPKRFAQLTSRVFGHGTCPVGSLQDQNNLFNKGSLDELLSWSTDSWWIPRDEDLSRMERLLCKQTDPQPGRFLELELSHYSLRKFRCYFSAASIAIDYLHRLPSRQLANLRKIVLNEDRMSILRPACHMRGLISFCKRNSALRIEHKIGLLKNLLPETTPFGADDMSTSYIMGSTCLLVFVPWVKEAMSLSANGMPIDAYQVIIDGSTKEAVHAFEIMKYAAAMQEAMLTQAKRNGVQPTPWVRDPQAYSTVSLPWQLPAGFFDTVRGIVNGTSNIRFMGPVGEAWDTDLMFFERKDWTEADWRKEWLEKIIGSCSDTTFFEGIKTQYEL